VPTRGLASPADCNKEKKRKKTCGLFVIFCSLLLNLNPSPSSYLLGLTLVGTLLASGVIAIAMVPPPPPLPLFFFFFFPPQTKKKRRGGGGGANGIRKRPPPPPFAFFLSSWVSPKKIRRRRRGGGGTIAIALTPEASRVPTRGLASPADCNNKKGVGLLDIFRMVKNKIRMQSR